MANQAQQETLNNLQRQTGGQIVEDTIGSFEKVMEYDAGISAEDNKEINVRYDYCRVRVPGDIKGGTYQLVRKEYPECKRFPEGKEVYVSEYHINRYSQAWDAFIEGKDLKAEGTQLHDCPDIPKAAIPRLKACDVHTVEELAQVGEKALHRIGKDGRILQGKAKNYLEERDSAGNMRSELDALRAELAELKKPKPKPKAKKVTNGDNQSDTTERSADNRGEVA